MTESVESQIDSSAPTPEEVESFEQEVTPEAAPAPELTKAETKALENAIKEYSLKVNGKEVKTKIDLNDDARIIKALQLEAASQEAFQRAAAKEKELASMNEQLDQFFNLLKTDPLKVLMNKDLGLNAEELANKILDMKIEDEMKTPEQKALEEAKAKLEAYEKAEREAREEAERLRMEKMEAEYEKEFTESISNAIDKGDLPKSPYIIAKFGQLMEVALEQQLDVKAEDLIPIIKNAYLKDMKEMMGKLPDEVIEELAGPDRIKGIRNKRIQAVKQANAKANAVKVEDTASKPRETQPAGKRENFFKKLGDW